MKITLIVLCTALVVCVSGRGLDVEIQRVKADATSVGRNAIASSGVVETHKGKAAFAKSSATQGVAHASSSSGTGHLNAWEREGGDGTAEARRARAID